MILDGHIHLYPGAAADGGEQLLAAMRGVDIGGGCVISRSPKCFPWSGEDAGAADRIAQALSWCAGRETLYPVYWIDPTEPDAVDQVDYAVSEGIQGFKVICGHHMPADPAVMPVYRRMARHGKSLLFHSGILWDGQPSGEYNRPAGFEGLLRVEGLRFALAHIAWPWVDECLAVYGKFQNALTEAKDLSVEMFIDITPGTPPIYRREALTKLHTIGYDVENNILFGTDCDGSKYNAAWVKDVLTRDNAIYAELGLPADILAKTYGQNLLRFLGITGGAVAKKPLVPGEL